MKNLTILLLFNFILLNGYGQEKIATVTSEKTRINLIESVSLKSQFLDSLFYKGRVIYNNGKSSSALMNYNLLDNSIYFLDKDKKLLKLIGLNSINSINYAKRFFYVFNGEVYEQLYSSEKISLLLKLKTHIKNNNVAKGPYGTTLEPSSIETYSTSTSYDNFDYNDYILGYNSSKKDKINIDILLNKDYYLQVNGKLKKISKVRDLVKLFPSKKNDLYNYINDNNLVISKEQDLIKLVTYCINNN